MKKDPYLERTMGMILTGGAAGGAAAMLTNSWTKPITETRTLNGISNGGPAQGVVQGAPAATRTKSVYSWERENPKKKYADAIQSVVQVGGAMALNAVVPGAGTALNSVVKSFDGDPENHFYSDGSRPDYSKAFLTGQIDPLSGQPVDLSGFNGSLIKAPTGTRSMLEDIDTSWTTKKIDLPFLLEGKVKKEYIPLLTKGLSDNPLLNDMLIPKTLF